MNQGHCHPKILAAMVEQAGRLTLTSRAFRNDQLAPFYEELAALTGSHKVLPMNTGAEAVETAIKAARKWGYEVKGVPEGQAEIIVCADNFHGRTIGIVGFSTDPDARGGFGPVRARLQRHPLRRRRRAGGGDHAEHRRASWSSRSRARPASSSRRPATSAASASSAPQHDVMLILDEIQTGLGRTGKLLAEEHEGIEADVTLIGKALGGGFYPVSAVLSNTDVLGVLQPGQHGSTFGGNPLACAVARAALRVLVEEGMIENAGRAQGAHFLRRPRGDPRQQRPRGARPRPDAGGRAASRGRPARAASARRCTSGASSPRTPTGTPSASRRRW